MPVQVPAAHQQLTSFRPSGKLAAVSQNFEQQAGSGTYDVSAGKL
jgi:hypothetical protein